MGKNQRERKERKRAQKRPQGATLLGPDLDLSEATPEARAALQRFERGGQGVSREHFIKAMAESGVLREEPELRDLHFDQSRAEQIMSRVMSQAGMEQLPDNKTDFMQLRIEVVERLATPEFRADLTQRLDRLIQRLVHETDAQKLEKAVIVKLALSNREIPWGAVGLLDRLLEEANARFHLQYERNQQLLGALKQVAGPESDSETALKLLDDPDALPPDLMATLEEQFQQMLLEFENELAAGQTYLGLFTDDELSRGERALLDWHNANHPDLDSTDREAIHQQTRDLLGGLLAEIMTPPRLDKMKADLEQYRRRWARNGNRRSELVKTEARLLDYDEPRENAFLIAAYKGELRRRQRRQGP